VNRYLRKSVGEEIERKHKVLHVLTNEIRSRAFLPRSFNMCLIPFVLKKSVHPSAQNQNLSNGDIARCPRCRGASQLSGFRAGLGGRHLSDRNGDIPLVPPRPPGQPREIEGCPQSSARFKLASPSSRWSGIRNSYYEPQGQA